MIHFHRGYERAVPAATRSAQATHRPLRLLRRIYTGTVEGETSDDTVIRHRNRARPMFVGRLNPLASRLAGFTQHRGGWGTKYIIMGGRREERKSPCLRESAVSGPSTNHFRLTISLILLLTYSIFPQCIFSSSPLSLSPCVFRHCIYQLLQLRL